MSRALALDLGGTRLRAALVEAGREAGAAPLGVWPAPVDLASFQRQVADLIARHGATRLGVAVPGLAAGSTCVWAPNLPWLDAQDLALLFPSLPAALGNDARLALLAEKALGAAGLLSDAILLAIGTGIGSAVLADGRIVHGNAGAAASFGWACADLDDRGSLSLGWLERRASGTALDAIARGMGLADGAALIAAARGGNAAALDALKAPAAALGATLAGAVALLGSSCVLVSGGVAEGLDVLAPLILPELRRRLPPHLRGVTMAPGRFGARAALVGAALAAQDCPLWNGGRA